MIKYADNSEIKSSDIKAAAVLSRKSPVNLSTYQYSRRMPNLRGKSLRQAVAILQAMDMDVKINGTGVVVSQYPEKNELISASTQCIINLEPRRINLE